MDANKNYYICRGDGSAGTQPSRNEVAKHYWQVMTTKSKNLRTSVIGLPTVIGGFSFYNQLRMDTLRELRKEYKDIQELIYLAQQHYNLHGNTHPLLQPLHELFARRKTINQILTAFYHNEFRRGKSFLNWR